MIIRGTITAGETAANTLPNMAASNIVIPNNLGAIKMTPKISKHAGTKHISTAGLPALFKSPISKDKPALVRMITKASLLRSAEIPKILSSNALKT